MKLKDIEIGKIYQHDAEGVTWNVRVTAIERKNAKLGRERSEWTGVVAGKQHHCQNGDACWGYVDDLRLRPLEMFAKLTGII